jgi:4-amino-4-deoxy-L-arabinose transferase-like glycosyltransferase
MERTKINSAPSISSGCRPENKEANTTGIFEGLHLLIILLLASFVFIYNLGTGSLTSWDEGVYAGVSGEILKSNNWFDLTWRDAPWSDKPPLYMWMTVLFYKIFGLNEFAVRFFSALCGIGTVILTYLLARKLYSRNVAVVAGLLLLSTQHFIWSAKIGMLDCALTFFAALSFFFFKLGEEKKIYLFFSCLAFALAFLTKGVAAIIIPAVLIIYIIFTKKFSLLKEPYFLFGAFISFFILLWWHWLAISHYGDNFIFGYFTKHLFVRTTQSVDGHNAGILNYFKVIPNKGRPWGTFMFMVLPFIIFQIAVRKEKAHFLPFIWLVTVFIIASFIKTKLHWYIISIYPASSVLIAWAFNKLFKNWAIPVTFILTICSLLYLSQLKKGIFNLDYTPETKRIAQEAKHLAAKEKILLYRISDPAMQFYCLNSGENLNDTLNFEELLKIKGRYIILDKAVFDNFKQFAGPNTSLITQGKDFILIYNQK